jgi:ribosomal protein L13
VPIEMAARHAAQEFSQAQLLKKLKVYPTTEHPHAAQKPAPLAV